MLGGLQTFWWFLVLIGVMILLHELGHYLVARLFDVHIEAFSFGFGPRLFGFQRGETDFKVCAFPLGGFVKMAGEQTGEPGSSASEDISDPRAFPAKPRWQRLLIILAGPVVNLVLAVGILTGLYMFHYPKVANPPNPIVGTLDMNGVAAKVGLLPGDLVVEVDGQQAPTYEDISRKEMVGVGRAMHYVVERNGQRLTFDLTPVTTKASGGAGTTGWSPQTEVQVADLSSETKVAENAGIRIGDILVSLNGQPIHSPQAMISSVERSAGAPVEVVYSHDGQPHTVTVKALHVTDPDGSQHWRIGASLQPRVDIVQLPVGAALGLAWHDSREGGLMIYRFLQGLIEQRMSPKSISGPLGIAQMSGEAARRGPVEYLNLMAMVSLNLAVVNMLPIPLLDGGGILMLLIEMLMQRDLSMRVKEGIVKVGFAFLMMVIVFVLYNDITKMLPGG